MREEKPVPLMPLGGGGTVSGPSHLRLMNDISSALNTSLGERPSFRQALSLIQEGLGASSASLLALRGGGARLETLERVGEAPGKLAPEALNRFFQEAASVVDLVTAGLARDVGYHADIVSSGLAAHPDSHYAMVTLKSRRRPVGLLYLGFPAERGISEEEALLLSALGYQLGAALENAWLFEEVSHSREEWQATFDAMEEIIVVTDGEGRFRQANRSFLLRMEGEAGDGDLTAAKERFFRRVLRLTPGTVPADLAGTSWEEDEPDSGRTWRVSASRAGDPGGSLVFVARDVTVEKRLGELQELNRQLAESNRIRSSFMAKVSHDLRTPLNAIIGFSEVLMQGGYGEVNEKQARYLRLIHEGGKHLLELINDVLDLARLDAGKLELEPRKVGLGGVAESTMALFEEEARRRQVALVLDRPPGDVEVWADEKRLRQVLYNLLSNAVKFASGGGRAGVRIGRLEGGALVEVWDTGMGIPAEKHDFIFEEYARHGGREGAGLGLAIARQLVELHGGKIWVESAEGKGSSFFFTLPAGRPGGAEKKNGAGGVRDAAMGRA